MSAPIIAHPLLDGRGEGWAATETRADVVALTVGMSDFLHRVSTAGERPIVVSGEFSRMTQPLAEALSAVQGHWVIRTADRGCYDARTGAPLDEPAAVLALPPHPTRDGVHAAFTRAAVVDAPPGRGDRVHPASSEPARAPRRCARGRFGAVRRSRARCLGPDGAARRPVGP